MTLSVLETSLPMQRSHDTLAFGIWTKNWCLEASLVNCVRELNSAVTLGKIFCKQTTSIFLSRKHTISRMNWIDLLSTPGCFSTLKRVLCTNNWFMIYEFHILWLNVLWKFSLHVLWKMLLFLQFSKWWQIQNVVICKYLFPSFFPSYHNLKADSMSDGWLP